MPRTPEELDAIISQLEKDNKSLSNQCSEIRGALVKVLKGIQWAEGKMKIKIMPKGEYLGVVFG